MKIDFVHRPVMSLTPPRDVVRTDVHRPVMYKSLTTPPRDVVVPFAGHLDDAP